MVRLEVSSRADNDIAGSDAGTVTSRRRVAGRWEKVAAFLCTESTSLNWAWKMVARLDVQNLRSAFVEQVRINLVKVDPLQYLRFYPSASRNLAQAMGEDCNVLSGMVVNASAVDAKEQNAWYSVHHGISGTTATPLL
jgi:hypothetical protein